MTLVFQGEEQGQNSIFGEREGKKGRKENGGMRQLREEWNFRDIYALKWRRK